MIIVGRLFQRMIAAPCAPRQPGLGGAGAHGAESRAVDGWRARARRPARVCVLLHDHRHPHRLRRPVTWVAGRALSRRVRVDAGRGGAIRYGAGQTSGMRITFWRRHQMAAGLAPDRWRVAVEPASTYRGGGRRHAVLPGRAARACACHRMASSVYCGRFHFPMPQGA